MNAWQPIRTDDGSYTLAHPLHGETCHSRAGAWQESRERYAEACRLRVRAHELAREGRTTFRLLDIGTGLGLNLAAALEALDGTGVALEVVSLELERDVLAATLALGATEIRTLERFHAPVREAFSAALADPERAAGTPGIALAGGSIRLLLGDGRATLRALDDPTPFDAVFLDPFSPAIDPSLWESEFLAEVARRMARLSRLSTYSASLAVRAGLVAARLQVGPGGRVGTKSSGTLAGRGIDLDPFDPRSARRIQARAARIGLGDET